MDEFDRLQMKDEDIEQLRAHISKLTAGAQKLLDTAVMRRKGMRDWYWQCRHCEGHSPAVSDINRAERADIKHRNGCVVKEMEILTGVVIVNQ